MFYGLGGHEGYININQIERIIEKEHTYIDEDGITKFSSYILKFQSGNEIEVSKEVVQDIVETHWYTEW